MAKRKAPKDHPSQQIDPSSEAWNKLPWRKLEKHCFRIQKRMCALMAHIQFTINNPVQPEDVAHLSAYMTEHLQRFGEYTLKLRPVAPLSNQEKTFSDPLSEQSGDSKEMSA